MSLGDISGFWDGLFNRSLPSGDLGRHQGDCRLWAKQHYPRQRNWGPEREKQVRGWRTVGALPFRGRSGLSPPSHTLTLGAALAQPALT